MRGLGPKLGVCGSRMSMARGTVGPENEVSKEYAGEFGVSGLGFRVLGFKVSGF